jgi:hypothetical protein
MTKGLLTILTLGAIGGIFFTGVTHPAGLKALVDGVDSLYKSAIGGTLGQVA